MSEEGVGFLCAGTAGGWLWAIGYRKPNSGALGEQYMLLTVEPSFQPKQYFLKVEALVKVTMFVGVRTGRLVLGSPLSQEP